MSTIPNLLVSILGQPNKVTASGKQFTFNCPNCANIYNHGRPDNSYNLEVNLQKVIDGQFAKVWHCWKCNEAGKPTLDRLFRMFGSFRDVQIYRDIEERDNPFGFALASKQVREKVIRLPNEFIPFSKIDYDNEHHLKALYYLTTTRKIKLETALYYRIGFCLEGEYANRVIIPSYDLNGDVNFFLGRSWLPSAEKHRNPSVDKNGIIFNEYFINWNAPVFLTEGGFELLSYPGNNLVMLGKVVQNTVLRKILKHRPPIIVAINKDAFGRKKKPKKNSRAFNPLDFTKPRPRFNKADNTLGIINAIIDEGHEDVYYWDYPENDLNDCLENRGQQFILDSVREDVKHYSTLPDFK